MTEQAQPLNVNTLCYVHVTEEVVQVFVRSNTEIITNTYCRTFLLNTFSDAATDLNSDQVSAAYKTAEIMNDLYNP